MSDINYALVESARPPLYTAMKYWGKKPHNIWAEYIKHYTPENGLYLDPFTGSSVSALEAYKAGKRVIAFDLNPLSSFMIEVLTSEFNQSEFQIEVEKVIREIEADSTYQKYFTTQSRHEKNTALLQHAKWESGKIVAIGVCDIKDGKLSKPYMTAPNKADLDLQLSMESMDIPYWIPDQPFHDTPSISGSFVTAIGGNKFSNLWTKRNLFVLSKIFVASNSRM